MENENPNSLNELINLLEIILKKSSNDLEISQLINDFNIKYNVTKIYLENKLKSSDYTKDSLYNENELDELSKKLFAWKNKYKNPKFKRLCNNVESLVNSIKLKNLTISDDIMNIDVPNDIKNQNGFNFWQQQKQLLDKKKVIQAQDLTFLNDNFGRALASLECYANRKAGKRISNLFDYYNMFNLGYNQQLDELQKKAFVQTQLFKLSYDDYIKSYKKYDPPNNINLNKIQNLLKKWMSYVDEESKIIYQGMINVLSSLNNSVFDKKFRAISQKYNYARMAPKKISSFAGGIYYYNHQRCQEAKNKYMQNGKIISSLNINQNYKDDKNAENLLKYVKNNELNIQNRYDDYK